MRAITLATVLFVSFSTDILAQEKFISNDYQDYYQWFHRYSQVADLYTEGSLLFIFGERAAVHQGPCKESDVITNLNIGQMVENIAFEKGSYLPEDEINGYHDFWFNVRGEGVSGSFEGYVWGADIARAWRKVDLNKRGPAELILLGISAQKRKNARDINAEIRIVEKEQLIFQITVPGLCIFEECASSSLLRIIEGAPLPGEFIIEASTMTMGCWAGIEKHFYFWKNDKLQPVFAAEFTNGKVYYKKTFNFKSKKDGNLMVCEYLYEDESFCPVWTCRQVETDSIEEVKPAFAAKQHRAK